MCYVGLVSINVRLEGGPYFTLLDSYRMSQWLPFSDLWIPPRRQEFPEDMWNPVDRTYARSGVGVLEIGQGRRCVQESCYQR